ATLAAANLVFLLLLVGGGVIVPMEKFPDAVAGTRSCPGLRARGLGSARGFRSPSRASPAAGHR
ncbi:hypothetical protein ACWCSV_22820, partial [Streptomyces sp. NPDC001770]